jgi:hypothetical protein
MNKDEFLENMRWFSKQLQQSNAGEMARLGLRLEEEVDRIEGD